jgi:hypothetical protein
MFTGNIHRHRFKSFNKVFTRHFTGSKVSLAICGATICNGLESAKPPANACWNFRRIDSGTCCANFHHFCNHQHITTDNHLITNFRHLPAADVAHDGLIVCTAAPSTCTRNGEYFQQFRLP